MPVFSPTDSVGEPNFWDTNDALLEFSAVNDPGSQPARVALADEGIVSNEGDNSTINCMPPVGRAIPGATECNPSTDPGNRNHNTAAFPVPADLAGNLVSLRMMNHNADSALGAPVRSGRFRTWNTPGEEGRLIHVCYPYNRLPGSIDDRLNLSPIDTRTDCNKGLLPSCESHQTSLQRCPSSLVWNPNDFDSARSINDCRHAPGTDPLCGETPEWMYSAPESVDGGIRYPMVIVAANAVQKYKLVGRLFNMECIEETGWDRLGSDHIRSTAIAARLNETTGIPEAVQFQYKGDDYDTRGDDAREPFGRYLKPARLMALAQDVRLNETVLFTMALSERDCESTACKVLVSSIVVSAVAATAFAVAYFCPPCAEVLASWSGIGGMAAVTTTLVYASWEIAGEDPIGSQTFAGTPVDFGERATASALGAFERQGEGEFPGPMASVPIASTSGSFENYLVDPMISQTTVVLDPAEVGMPGGKLQGFREERRIKGGGGNYRMRMLWQRLRCDSDAECQSLPDPKDATKP